MGFLILNHDADSFHQEIYLRGLNLKFKNLKLAESVKSAQVATATLYKRWQKINFAKISPESRLTSVLSLTTQWKMRDPNYEAGTRHRYWDQGEPGNSTTRST